MKYVKFLVALLAACMLVMPAFSMPNFDNRMSDGKDLVDAPCQNHVAGDQPQGPQPCDCKKDHMEPKSMMGGKCDKPMIGPEADKCAIRSMMENRAPCGEQAPQMNARGEKCMMAEKAPCEQAARMDAREEKSMMDEKFAPQDNGKCAPKSMMEGRFAPQDGGKCTPRSMMDGTAPCHEHIGGQDNEKVPAPMMDGKEPNQGCPCQDQ